jgi:CheY-like chemotaxis protein
MPHILIVDDDEDDRDLLSDALHEIDPNIKCLVARNGQEAFLGLSLHHYPEPDLIFLDLNMPRLDGMQFLRVLKKDRSLQHIPVVIYSTSKLVEEKEECMHLGAVHFITKPSSFRELRRLISDVLIKEMIVSS